MCSGSLEATGDVLSALPAVGPSLPATAKPSHDRHKAPRSRNACLAAPQKSAFVRCNKRHSIYFMVTRYRKAPWMTSFSLGGRRLRRSTCGKQQRGIDGASGSPPHRQEDQYVDLSQTRPSGHGRRAFPDRRLLRHRPASFRDDLGPPRSPSPAGYRRLVRPGRGGLLRELSPLPLSLKQRMT